MSNQSGNDMIIKLAAAVTIIGVLVANGLLIFGGATKEQITTLSGAFHEFAVSVDSRLRTVENAQFQEREQIANGQSAVNDLKLHLDEIEKASRASLSPGRH